MFENYEFPKLRNANLTAAYDVCRLLQEEKFLSDKAFKDCIRDSKNAPNQILPQNFDNIIIFLVKHGMVTKESINGLVCWAATQKCFRSNSNNWFIEYQEVTRFQIEASLDYQKINDGKVPFEIEGKVIAENILNLKGKVAKEFIEQYDMVMERCDIDEMMEYMDRAVLNAIEDIKEIKRI